MEEKINISLNPFIIYAIKCIGNNTSLEADLILILKDFINNEISELNVIISKEFLLEKSRLVLEQTNILKKKDEFYKLSEKLDELEQEFKSINDRIERILVQIPKFTSIISKELKTTSEDFVLKLNNILEKISLENNAHSYREIKERLLQMKTEYIAIPSKEATLNFEDINKKLFDFSNKSFSQKKSRGASKNK